MENGKRFKMWIHSAKQIVQVVNNGALVLKGKEMQNVAVLEQVERDGKMDKLGIVVDRAGRILDLGFDSVLEKMYKREDFEKVIDAAGRCILPGLIDAHTHPVWAGDRVHEFSMKLAGASYMDIHKAGGGIYFTVDHTCRASETELLELLKPRLKLMLQNGTTLAEAKSGYGLDVQNELKLLRVLHQAHQSGQLELSITYCGAHAVPKNKTSEEATEDIVTNQLPALKRELDTGSIHVRNVDVFCEKNVFSPDQTKRILEKSAEYGLLSNFHAEELSYLGGVEMGASIGAAAISHLEYISDEGITAMAQAASVAVLLPTTAFLMRLTPPPVRRMIENGVAVALGTDFNPNAYCLSMPIVMHLASVMFHMSLPEVLIASTINAAASLKMSDAYGSIEKGKFADLLLVDAPSWEHLIYQLGNNSLIHAVLKKGQVVYESLTM